MKTKRLVIILSVLIFITLIIVLCSAVFTVQTISVNWLTQPNVLTVSDNEEIIQNSAIKKYNSVFTLKKQDYIDNIEKNISYIKVVKIEVKFPNKVVIHAMERDPYYYIFLGGLEYMILDSEMKVLQITDDFTKYVTDFRISPIELDLDSTLYSNLDLGRGDFLNMVYSDTFKQFATLLSDYGFDSVKARRIVKTLSIKDGNLSIYTNLGLNIFINDYVTNFSDKMLRGFSAYEQYKDDYSTGTILCYSSTYFVPEDIEEYN